MPLYQSVAGPGAGYSVPIMVMMCSNDYQGSVVFSLNIPTTNSFEFTIRAPMHELRWQSSDREPHRTKDGSTPSSDNSSSVKEKTRQADYLSNSSIAAISSCVSFAVLALIVIAVLVFRKRMQSSRHSAQMEFVASRGSTLPEAYHDTDTANQPEKIALLHSPQPLRESLTTPIEAAPRYEAEDTSAAARTS